GQGNSKGSATGTNTGTPAWAQPLTGGGAQNAGGKPVTQQPGNGTLQPGTDAYKKANTQLQTGPIQAANAKQLADQFDRDPEWMVGFGKHNPDKVITDGAAAARMYQVIDRSRAPEHVLKGAGFNVIDTGRDVRNLDGFGIRSAQAAFDPAKAGEQGILLSLGALALSPGLFGLMSRPDPSRIDVRLEALAVFLEVARAIVSPNPLRAVLSIFSRTGGLFFFHSVN
ncbi:hypothetical protein AB4144_03250, partial [Rhizobiaceae sp. 2RAB30]